MALGDGSSFSMYGTSSAGTPTAQYGLFSDWASMIQGVASGGGISGGPLGGEGAAAGVSGAVAVGAGGIDIWASLGEMKAAGAITQYSEDILGLDEQTNALRQQQAHLQTNRQRLQNLRDAQRAGAISRAAAANQGALFGSGEAGGQSGIRAQAATTELGLNQNLQIADQTFAIANQIDAYKMRIAAEQGKEATLQGYANVAQGLMNSATSIGKMAAGMPS